MATRERTDRTRTREKRTNDIGVGKKRSHLLQGVKVIDGNDVEFLRKFTTEQGKILPARLTGANSKQQRCIKRLVRRSRVLGLLA